MRELDTLRVSGSAGRVDDRAEVVGLDPREARRDLRRTRRPMTDPFRDLLVDQRNRLQRAAHLELGRQLGIRRDGKSSARVLDDLVGDRSEEHTSELQSQSNLVCRLLLEKKKNEESS